MNFILHPNLLKTSFFIKDFKLSKLLLNNNSLFPWLILVPKIDNIREIIELDDYQKTLLMDEISIASKTLKAAFATYKINVASLGNITEQLHIHVIARNIDDPAWPNAPFNIEAVAYKFEDRIKIIEKINSFLETC